MKTSQKGIDLIKKYEGLELKAYPDPGSGSFPFTIGYGSTVYPNGVKVKLGDKITKEQAEEYLKHDLIKFEKELNRLITSNISQNQFDSLISFIYNLGAGNLSKSTLLRKINLNPNDLSIADEFKKWIRANNKILKGLKKRREEESNLYFLK